MTSANGYVADPQLTLMPSAHFEMSVFTVRHDHVYHTARILLKCERLKPEEVFVFGDVDVDEAESVSIRFEDVGVGRFADFALELLPYVGDLIWLLLNGHLLLEPKL